MAPERVRLFGQANPPPQLQDYLTLNALRRRNFPAPDGVAEHQGRPVLYFVDEQRLGGASSQPKQTLFDDPADLPVIYRQLACRGERAYLARVQHGRLVVAPVSPTEKEPNWVEYTPDTTEGRCLFSRLVHGVTAGEDFAAGDVVFDQLFKLIKHAANRIARNVDLRPDALSLVGRALFFRFLRDRGVLNNYPVSNIAPAAFDWSDCFQNPKNASDTCAWLDRTFNGDFLMLTENGSEAFFRHISDLTNGEVFKHLTAVVRGHQPSGNDYQPLLSWGWQEFDFAHIPVGLLSQVYEAFSWEWTPKEARKTSQRYTPRNIAVTLMEEVLDDLPSVTNCRVLDPACGAGVFLVLAFRRLYLERWKAAKRGKRPGTEDIRRILEDQLVGLDISESALKLAALSLYLTAIELDPEPSPPDKLRFKKLRGHVLHNVREPEAKADGPALGSLSKHMGTKFHGLFDVVLSNPPWTSVDTDLGSRMATECREILGRIGGVSAGKFELPDNNPDMPFIIKSMEWCKPGGRIAMALPARVLLKTEAKPREARNTLFRALTVDGIVNGTNLADTLVWPEMNQPWMLLFASNKPPGPRHSIPFVTIPLEVSLNRAGKYRIDAESTRTVELEMAVEKPWIWKALSVGTMLDVEVVEKMNSAGGEPLDDYWKRVVGKYRSGKGYKVAEKQTDLKECKHLKGLPDLNSTELFRFVVDTDELKEFTRDRICRPRRSSIYDPPLALIKQTPGEGRKNGRALLAFRRLAYNESFNGYSAAGHPDGESLVRYLHLFVHSDIWLFYLLVTSPEFGAERRRARKSDLGNCPFIPLENLSAAQRKEMLRLSRLLEEGGAIPWNEIDEFFAEVYGLRANDLRVILDTLNVALPYETARHRACRQPKQSEKRVFLKALKETLTPFVKTTGSGALAVEEWGAKEAIQRVTTSFNVLVLTAGGRSSSDIVALADGAIEKAVGLADEAGASQVVLTDPNGLVVGLFDQYRYWTLSRARLLSGEIVRYHLDAITG
ncbi:MAG: class I SAM-dependent DNA methyltransferase [Isosphaeraceae bacterium]